MTGQMIFTFSEAVRIRAKIPHYVIYSYSVRLFFDILILIMLFPGCYSRIHGKTI